MRVSVLTTGVWAERAARRRRIRAVVRARSVLVVLCLWIALCVPSEGYLGPERSEPTIRQATRSHGFQLAAWEVQALAQKVRDLVAAPGSNLTTAQQHELVEVFFQTIERIDSLDARIRRVYATSAAADAGAEAQALAEEVEVLRAEQARSRPAVERILEQQVTAALAQAGITTAGLVWPPVRFQFTDSPAYLIVSPRDRIVVERGSYLDPALPLAERQRIEAQVEARHDVSALVEDTGGFSSYPTMVLETSSLAWSLETIVHEWVHTYLLFRPLGWSYFSSGAMRTINETVASIVGEEVARTVLFEHYPERVRPATWPMPFSMRPEWLGKEETGPSFDYGAFMRRTRLETDRLLADGRIEEAEAFMEQQRQVLLKHGYTIRKLNQAYFAFHGSYAVGPTATDPIGGRLEALRLRSASLKAFLQTVGRFTEESDLDAALRASSIGLSPGALIPAAETLALHESGSLP